VIERPTVNVPVFWFVMVIIFATGGVAALVYFLVLHRDVSARKNDGKPAPLHATILDAPVKRKEAEQTIGEMNNPGVHFPPSLEKKYNRPEFIGEGGLARVFRAYRTKDGTLVAVKVPIRFDEVTGSHFTKDILFWQNLHHRNIIEIYASNILPVPYIEMEYARASLGDMQLPVDEEQAVALIQGIAAGLAYAHANGIVHRDIKPENILITADGTPKITDWGLGKMMSNSRQSSVIGYSLAYAAPEQIAPQVYGRPGPWTDIYQIGILLYEMLTGSTPGERDGVHDINRAILHEKPPEPVWDGTRVQALGAIIMKCLEKNPKDRYDSVSSLIHALDQVPRRNAEYGSSVTDKT
jgi:serine/threonine protein kinase